MITEVSVSADAYDGQEARLSYGEIAFRMAGDVAALVNQDRGGLAALRRMNPDAPEATVFWRLLAKHNQLGKERTELESKWALILHGIAVMTPTQRGEGLQFAHNGNVSVGKALFEGDGERGGNAFYSESRLSRLLNARGAMLRTLLARTFRMLAAKGVTFDWREMARFILNSGYDETSAEQSRRRIASEYYRARRRVIQSEKET